MVFKDPLRVLILPAGVTPPVVGQPVIFITPGPSILGDNSPEMRFYTGDADEELPSTIRGFVNAFGAFGLSETSAKRNNSTRRASLALRSGTDALPDVAEAVLDSPKITLDITDPAVNGIVNILTDGGNSFFEDAQITLGDNVDQSLLVKYGTGFFTTAPRMTARQSNTGTDVLNLTNTAYAAPATSVGFSFIGPPSGVGLLFWRARINVTTTAAVLRTAFVAPRLGTGSTVGAGTAQALEGVTSPQDDCAISVTKDQDAIGDSTGHYSGHTLVIGLTEGAAFNLQLQARISSGVTANYDLISQSITWAPLY